jgi:hypothetical protein
MLPITFFIGFAHGLEPFASPPTFEQFHQAIRRSWRFGQKHPVTIDIVTSEGESGVLANLMRKAENAEKLFANLVSLMGEANTFKQAQTKNIKTSIPSWL